MRFINKGGVHHMQDGTIVKNGEVFECDHDLRKVFINKFELVAVEGPVVNKPAPATPSKAPDAPAAEVEGDNAAAAKENTPTTDATDVTADFATAAPNALTVKKDKAGYWVMDDTDPVNEKALRSKKAVEAAIAAYLKD